MSKLNILVHLNAYQDENPTNTPSLNNLKWTRDMTGISIEEPTDGSIQLASKQSTTLFSGTVSLLATPASYNIELKSGTSNTYVITSDISSVFRTLRSSGHDSTTQITITKNGPVLTFTSTGGTALSLISGGVVEGDEVRIGSGFNVANRGTFKILARTATSFQIENSSGSAEGPITLGVDFADDLSIYSTTGVQISDKADLVDGFSSISRNLYEITDVSHNYIEIYSINSLPEESSVSNSPTAINVYRSGKQFLYLESDKKVNVTINGSSDPIKMEPFTVGTKLKPGMFLLKGPVYSVSIENTSNDAASIFYMIAE